jgi:uncharacterized membrane protein YGL010W
MRELDQLLETYGESHQNAINKAIHWLCIPAIVFSLMGLLASIPSGAISAWLPAAYQPYFNWATVFLLVSVVFYLRHSLTISIGMILFSVACIIGNVWLAQNIHMPLWQISLIIFAAAWVVQFIGHKIEGKKPSFLDDIKFLMVGPAWLLHFIYKKIGLKY